MWVLYLWIIIFVDVVAYIYVIDQEVHILDKFSRSHPSTDTILFYVCYEIL